jgi:hypothetical protein
MTSTPFNVGVFVQGPPTSPRVLVRHADMMTAYANGEMADAGETREGYLSHFVFGPEMQDHYTKNRNSVAGFAGPCWCRYLVLDIDRADLGEALVDARKLVAFLYRRYPEMECVVPVFFTGRRGFHILIELAHNPPPAVGFHRTARTFAKGIAAAAGVAIDDSIYDVNHIVRLPNTKHPRTGLFKRRIASETLFRVSVSGILEHAEHPAGDGIPSLRSCPAQLAADWWEAEQATARATEARAVVRRDAAATPDKRAPRYFLDFLRFGVPEGERHVTLFRAAAWLTEQGAPPSLTHALLVEPGLDLGLAPKDVARQIRCGIEHARKQHAAIVDPRPDPTTDPDAFERWAIAHEADPLPPGALDFPFGGSCTQRERRGDA